MADTTRYICYDSATKKCKLTTDSAGQHEQTTRIELNKSDALVLEVGTGFTSSAPSIDTVAIYSDNSESDAKKIGTWTRSGQAKTTVQQNKGSNNVNVLEISPDPARTTNVHIKDVEETGGTPDSHWYKAWITDGTGPARELDPEILNKKTR